MCILRYAAPTTTATIFWPPPSKKARPAVVVERSGPARPAELVVSDTLALCRTGGVGAREVGRPVVGVTGSAGKTTTKDAIAHLLETELPVGKTNGNFNNHVGVPLSLLRLPGRLPRRCLEMGMNHAGEIRRWPPSPNPISAW
jgi:UDP-N-acetylmuramoyl-tripeptide--D-alanyl-D-alanine ligase